MNILKRLPFLAMVLITAISIILIGLLIANISPDILNEKMSNLISINLVWAFVLLIFALAILIIFSVYQMVSDFRSSKGALIGIAFVFVLFGVAYLFGSNEYPTFFGVDKFIDDGTITHSIVRIIDTALYATYMMFFIAIIALVYSSICRYFR